MEAHVADAVAIAERAIRKIDAMYPRQERVEDAQELILYVMFG